MSLTVCACVARGCHFPFCCCERFFSGRQARRRMERRDGQRKRCLGSSTPPFRSTTVPTTRFLKQRRSGGCRLTVWLLACLFACPCGYLPFVDDAANLTALSAFCFIKSIPTTAACLDMLARSARKTLSCMDPTLNPTHTSGSSQGDLGQRGRDRERGRRVFFFCCFRFEDQRAY